MVLSSDVDSEYNPVDADAMVLSENSTSDRLYSNCISPLVDSSLSESCILRSCKPGIDPIDDSSGELKLLESVSLSIICTILVAFGVRIML